MTKKLVYIEAFHGKPTAQIWHREMTNGEGKQKPYLKMFPLAPEHDQLPIAVIEQMACYAMTG